jgi:hypothetical protein
LAKQPEDFHSLETALFRAREIGEELGEVVVLYFINMAIAEAKLRLIEGVRCGRTNFGPFVGACLEGQEWGRFDPFATPSVNDRYLRAP